MWSLLDADGKNLTMNTPEWKSLFEQVVAAYQSKSISQPSNAASGSGASTSSSKEDGKVRLSIGEDSNLFMAGRAAMMIDNSFLLNQMDMMKNMKKDVKPINWGVVTEPVDPSNPDVSDSFTISQILGINAQSAHIGAAWEFIKFVHSDEMAKIRSKSSPELISRSAYAVNKQGQSLEAFYKLKPNSNAATQLYPKGFRAAFSKITLDETTAAINKTKSLDDALAAIKDKGQKALTEANISGEKEAENEGNFMTGGISQVFIN
jgi:multiple sugar transport system substrate-binding protein